MTELALDRTPRFRDVIVEQIRVVGLSLRREVLLVAVVFVVTTLVVVRDILRGGAGFDCEVAFPTPLIAFLVPFAVWRGERRFGASFLWMLPVERRPLALARVFAGFVWMSATLMFFVAWLLVLGSVAHASAAETVLRIPLAATIGAYLFGSALVLGLRHPLRWLIGAVAVMLLIGAVSNAVDHVDDQEWRYVPGAHAFFSAVNEVASAWRTMPIFTQRTVATFLWIGAGLAALWAAASRHAERRRRDDRPG
ncbi:MAG TPA: hypothetical protein VF824_09625 [Thermoanaerobaculia bacterium]|jgi:hypothetical protein